MSRDAMDDFFSQHGFQVETACDGLECLGKVRSLKPYALVVDWDLPWGGAAAVLAFLKETHCQLEMPAILVVGDAPPTVRSQRSAVPRSSCFRTPVPMDSLLDRVELAAARIDL